MPAKNKNKKSVVGNKQTLRTKLAASSVGVKFMLAALGIILATALLTVGYLQWQDAQQADELKAKASSAQTSYDLLGKKEGVAAWICRSFKAGEYSENDVVFVNDNWKSVTPLTIVRTQSKDITTGVTVSSNANQREWYDYVSGMKAFTSSSDADISVAIATNADNVPGSTVDIGSIKQRDVNTCPTGK